MGWRLLEAAASQETASHALHLGQHIYLALEGPGERLAIVTVVDDPGDALARIDVGTWGVKLRAIGDDVQIKPRYPRMIDTHDPAAEEYHLACTSDGCSEVVFLRQDDKIFLTKTAVRLTLSWDSSEILVNSSLTGQEIPESDHVAVRQEEETEDEDLDCTTIVVAAPSNSTPIPSVARSEVVQETPTADRPNLLTEFSLKVGDKKDTVEDILPLEVTNLETVAPSSLFGPVGTSQSRLTAQDVFSTALTKPVDEEFPEGAMKTAHNSEESPMRSPADEAPADKSTPDGSDEQSIPETSKKPQRSTKKSHPQVQIPPRPVLRRRRSTPELEIMSSASSSDRPTKRAKKGDENNDETREPAPKRKKRVTLDAQECSPKVSRGSQGSITEEDSYRGPKPRVAFSNSGVPMTGTAVKFLKKHGGTTVESVKGEACNILCVKDGALRKSMKLLLSVALGIPIVTEEWLYSSVRVARFLDIVPYKPSVPEQEREWGFSLDDTWNKAKKNVFEGHAIYFTPALKATYKPFNEIDELCKAAGAKRVLSKPGKDIKDKDVADSTILLALASPDDDDAKALMQAGHACYTRDLITLSILRGTMDLESDEFRIKPVAKSLPKKKGRPKKN